MSCDMQRGSESCAVNLQRWPWKLFRLLLHRNQGAAGDVAMVSVQCAVCTGMSVLSLWRMQSACVFFPLLCTDLRCVCFLCTCWGCVSVCVWKLNDRVIAWAASWRRRRWASKWMFKTKPGEEGRRAGFGRGENASMHCGGWTGPEAYALVLLLLGLCKCIVSKFLLHV